MLLHVLNGDATRVPLERSGVPGRMTVWADVLHDGPVPDVPHEELLRIRGRHHAVVDDEKSFEQDLNELRAWYDALEKFPDYEEVVFWFEHDLFDQLILIRHLDWLSRIDPGGTRFSLICIGGFPGHPDFAGLGELSSTELATLFPGRKPISPEQIELGRIAWAHFRAADPVALAEWIADADTSALPFLAGALRRCLEDYPSVREGLARTEMQILRAVTAGHTTPWAIFVANQKMEERVYMGDLSFWHILRGLASGPHPLVTIAGDQPPSDPGAGPVALTNAGQDVLSGRADHIALNGIDRWIGGAHLMSEHHWRWDGARLTPVNSQRPTPNSHKSPPS